MRTFLSSILWLSLAFGCGGGTDDPSDGGGGRDAGGGFDDDAGMGVDDLPVPLTVEMGMLPGAPTRFVALCQSWVGPGEIAYSLVAAPVCSGGELYMYFVLEDETYTVLSGYRMNAATGERGEILRIESTNVGEIVPTAMGYFIDELPEGDVISLSTEAHSLLRFVFVGNELTIRAFRPI